MSLENFDSRARQRGNPPPDWVPLVRAPFYFGRRGRIQSGRDWEQHLRAQVRDPYSSGRWTFLTDRWQAFFELNNRTWLIDADQALVSVDGDDTDLNRFNFDDPGFLGTPDGFLQEEKRLWSRSDVKEEVKDHWNS